MLSFDELKLNLTAENLRYLLWRQEIRRDSWGEHLADWAKCSSGRAEELLNGAALQDEEQQRIAHNAKVREEEIQTERFLGDQVDVFRENILYLTNKEVTGLSANLLAKEIDVSPVSISRWKQGKQSPEDTQLLKLSRYFGFQPKVNLKQHAVFLWLSPIGDLKRRAWLQERIKQIDAETLNALYPALEKLLK